MIHSHFVCQIYPYEVEYQDDESSERYMISEVVDCDVGEGSLTIRTSQLTRLTHLDDVVLILHIVIL